MRTTRGVACVTLASLALVACTAAPDGESSTPSPSPSPETAVSAELRLPDEPTTVLDAAEPAVRAVAASEAFFASAPVVVVAPVADVAAQLDGAALAVSLGAPLLLVDGGEDAPEPAGETGGTPAAEPSSGASPAPTPSGGPAGADAAAGADAVVAEVERLGAAAVLAVGGADLDADVPVVPAPDGAADREEVLRTEPLPAPTAAAGAEVAAVAALTASSAPGAGTPEGETTAPTVAPSHEPSTEPSGEPVDDPSTARSDGAGEETDPEPSDEDGAADADADEGERARLPLTERTEAPAGGLLLTTGDVGDLAAVATTRAAGIPVLVVPSGDPRVGSATVRAVAAAAPTAVVALGAAFGPPDALGWKVQTAATGVELPGGGQTLFPGRRLVALYGTPTFPALGVLGEQDVAASVERARGVAAAYQALTTDTVVPAFEIIVTIASAGAGPDGNYSNELPVETFVPWVEAARDAGVYVVLDLQPGRTDFVTQARLYEPLLLYPNVGLALDPEWRLAPDQVHLRQIGSVHASEVNAVSTYLADLTRTHALPQKLFVLHQFSHRMIADRHLVDTSRPELATMIHVDGQGSQGAKAGTWASLQQGAPAGITWGWKNFIDEDVPMLTPAETYAVQPVPELVTYQ